MTIDGSRLTRPFSIVLYIVAHAQSYANTIGDRGPVYKNAATYRPKSTHYTLFLSLAHRWSPGGHSTLPSPIIQNPSSFEVVCFNSFPPPRSTILATSGYTCGPILFPIDEFPEKGYAAQFTLLFEKKTKSKNREF